MQKLKLKSKNFQKYINNIISNKLKLHELPEEMSEEERVEIRRKAIEEMTKTDLKNIGKFSFEAETAGKRNCENLIGGVQVPLGIAGPIKINGRYAKGEFYLPMATTEGALVASVSRGCKAITQSGGCIVNVVDIGITRASVFVIKAKGKRQKAKVQIKSKKLIINNWLEENFGKISQICENTSNHLELLKIEPFFEEEAVFLRFSFNTGLAMGMNMATIACAEASYYIEKETGLKLIALSGNVCCDKKASLLNFKLGRGKQVFAKVLLTKEILGEVLKTTAKDFYEVYRLKIKIGSKIAGTIGKNSQIANIASAIFLATGQDIAHIVEVAIGETKCELKGEEIMISVWLPDLPMGIVGGGTGLATQKECLEILGIKKINGFFKETDCLKLAEIFGGAVLAGEISLLAALASNDLAKAHERLGRGKKIF